MARRRRAPAGRPPLPPGERRRRVVRLRLLDAEFAALVRAAGELPSERLRARCSVAAPPTSSVELKVRTIGKHWEPWGTSTPKRLLTTVREALHHRAAKGDRL